MTYFLFSKNENGAVLAIDSRYVRLSEQPTKSDNGKKMVFSERYKMGFCITGCTIFNGENNEKKYLQKDLQTIADQLRDDQITEPLDLIALSLFFKLRSNGVYSIREFSAMVDTHIIGFKFKENGKFEYVHIDMRVLVGALRTLSYGISINTKEIFQYMETREYELLAACSSNDLLLQTFQELHINIPDGVDTSNINQYYAQSLNGASINNIQNISTTIINKVAEFNSSVGGEIHIACISNAGNILKRPDTRLDIRTIESDLSNTQNQLSTSEISSFNRHLTHSL